MSLSSKALDRLLARVVDRLAHAVPVKDLPLPVGLDDIDDALNRAAEKITKERFASYLDAGNFDHRVNDTIDYEVGNNLDHGALLDDARDKLQDIVEEKLDSAGFSRQVDRAIENLDLEALATEKLDEIDFEQIAKDAAEEQANQNDFNELAREVIIEKLAEVDPADMMKTHAGSFVEAALVARYGLPVGDTAAASARAAAEVISTAVCKLEDAANAALEQEVVS